MGKEKEINVGDVVYAPVYGRGGGMSPSLIRIDKYTVKRKGLKYLYVTFESWKSETKINKDTLKYVSEQYSQNNKQFFRTKEEILLLHEELTLLSDIKQFFYRHYSQPGDEGSLSLESLREIAKILSINYIQPIHLNAKEEANV